MEYFHIDTAVSQSSKKTGAPCGDAFFCHRSLYHTTLIVADGIGSGVRAHVASQMNVARLSQLLEGGMSLRDAFLSVAATVSGWRDVSMPFAAFTVARILNDGSTTILSYEMPPPVFWDHQGACVLAGEPLIVKAGVAGEYHCRIAPGEGLILVSDGIVQAGLGGSSSLGWTIEGAEGFLSGLAPKSRKPQEIADALLDEARRHDGAVSGDDKTVAVALCRKGLVVDVLTGPAADKARDLQIARDFVAREGLKVICGATTADIVARHTARELEVEQKTYSLSTPPRYFLEGIDLVTEGAVTLNQVCHIIQEDIKANYDRSAAADLVALLQEADFVRFTVGKAQNPANQDIVYRKQGILNREKVVVQLAEKLEQMGKLVSVELV